MKFRKIAIFWKNMNLIAGKHGLTIVHIDGGFALLSVEVNFFIRFGENGAILKNVQVFN